MEVVVKRENTVVVSDREVGIVKMLSNGVTVKQIAVEMGINRRTLENTCNRLRFDFDCNTLPQLVATFLRKKIIE